MQRNVMFANKAVVVIQRHAPIVNALHVAIVHIYVRAAKQRFAPFVPLSSTYHVVAQSVGMNCLTNTMPCLRMCNVDTHQL